MEALLQDQLFLNALIIDQYFCKHWLTAMGGETHQKKKTEEKHKMGLSPRDIFLAFGSL